MAAAQGAEALTGSSPMRLFFAPVIFAVVLSAPMTIRTARSQGLDLVLPTDNDALFSGDGAAFYQYIDRDYNGVKSTPWEGGQYGFVRDPKSTGGGVVYTRFHEGVDIRSVHRDPNGEPLDEVRAIADGEVVHTSLTPGYSNYGKYIVIEHRWNGSNYYSLYGHLSSIAVQPGERVTRGQRIAVMGYTGRGINRERAHLHLEVCLMFSRQFQAWYDTFFRNDPNHHGLYNGMNLAGLDVARLYLTLRKNPALTIPEFLGGEETFYKVALPKARHFDLPTLYPWMLAAGKRSGASWEVSFARSGVPLRIEASDKRVTQPEVSYVRNNSVECSYLTRDIVSGRGANAHLSGYGAQLMRLLIWPN
jgi:murein DD-endopeptidase MepM/ murein hydrolase activator NlpD